MTLPTRPTAAAIVNAITELHAAFGNRAVTSQAVREQHGNITTWHDNEPPDVVVFAQSTDDVVQAVKIAVRHGVPVIPFGTGTSLEGHVNAPLGGISIDVSQMNRILAVHEEDLDVVLEPGVTRKQLNEYLRDKGLFFPIDPGADASIGGMVATRASGTNAVRYGTMKDCVLALEVVLPTGEVMKTASRAKKSSAGYDLTRLFVGSEGTLGIVTQVTLRLQGIPEAVLAAMCSFPTVRAGADATIYTIQTGLPVARIELMDVLAVKAVNAYSKVSFPESPLLFVEFHGTEAGLAEQVERFRAIADECGASGFQSATTAEERSKLWQARHDFYWASLALRPGCKAIATDVCVPISRLADCIDATLQDRDAEGLVAPLVGHVGDGNFHVSPVVDMNDADELERVKAFISRLNQRAIAMDGTCTGEHGIGQGKRAYMEQEYGPAALGVMAAIKAAIDPQGLMNPGKILPS